jgi:adenylosuccinate synthase
MRMPRRYSSINITKLDVLSDLEEIKVAVGYKHKGKPLATFPSSLQVRLSRSLSLSVAVCRPVRQVLEQVEVVYETLPGWGVDISHARSFDQLPPRAQAYVRRLEQLVGVPINSVGVGPGREAMIRVSEY